MGMEQVPRDRHCSIPEVKVSHFVGDLVPGVCWNREKISSTGSMVSSWLRCRPVDSIEIHGARWEAAVAELEDVSSQSR